MWSYRGHMRTLRAVFSHVQETMDYCSVMDRFIFFTFSPDKSCTLPWSEIYLLNSNKLFHPHHIQDGLNLCAPHITLTTGSRVMNANRFHLKMTQCTSHSKLSRSHYSEANLNSTRLIYLVKGLEKIALCALIVLHWLWVLFLLFEVH